MSPISPSNLPWVIPIPPETPPLARAFTLVMQGLRFVLGQRATPTHPASGRWLALLSARVARLSVWLARLSLRVEAGRATPRRRPARRAGPPDVEPEAEGDPPPPRPPRLRLPHDPAWLFRLVPEAAGFRTELAELLNQPALAALLAAAPHAGGRLRGLCRALGIEGGSVPLLDLRPRRRPPRPSAPADPAAAPKPRRRFPRPIAAAPPTPPPPSPAMPTRFPPELVDRLPESLRPRPPPAASADRGAYPRHGWASLFTRRKEV